MLAALADLVDEGECRQRGGHREGVVFAWGRRSACQLRRVSAQGAQRDPERKGHLSVACGNRCARCSLQAPPARLCAPSASLSNFPAPPLPAPTPGLDREPELLQHLFGCVSLVCKHLVKLLTGEARLLGVLRSTQRLRHHRAHHVRVLAAESLGFLLRWGRAVRAASCSAAAGRAWCQCSCRHHCTS